MNSYGNTFRVTTYGESHGLAVGAIIDGCPAGVAVDMEAISTALARRRDGAPRQEEDTIEWLSGLKAGITLGTPIAFAIGNHNTCAADYTPLEHLFRPGHADYTYWAKYGIRDNKGGGRASARETVARVVAGALAKQLLPGVDIATSVDCPPPTADGQDSVGGVVGCRITGIPAGVGEPIFGKLGAKLAEAMMSIPSATGFEVGAGFAAAQMTGRSYADQWLQGGRTATNHCGGIQGGISNGMPIEFRVAFHPAVSVRGELDCLHEDGHIERITLEGRHDRCHARRAAVVVEAMTALCLVNLRH